MAGKPRKDAYHHGDLARALVDAAVALVAERGLEGLTLIDAARRAGVSHTAVYRHFDDKRALLVAIAERGFDRLAHAMKRALATAPVAPRARFLHVGRAVVRFAVDDAVLYRVMFAGVKPAALNELAAAPPDSAFGLLLGLVGDLQRERFLRRGGPLRHAVAIWSATHGVAMLAAAGELPSSPKALAAMADAIHGALLDGLRPR